MIVAYIGAKWGGDVRRIEWSGGARQSLNFLTVGSY